MKLFTTPPARIVRVRDNFHPGHYLNKSKEGYPHQVWHRCFGLTATQGYLLIFQVDIKPIRRDFRLRSTRPLRRWTQCRLRLTFHRFTDIIIMTRYKQSGKKQCERRRMIWIWIIITRRLDCGDVVLPRPRRLLIIYKIPSVKTL